MACAGSARFGNDVPGDDDDMLGAGQRVGMQVTRAVEVRIRRFGSDDDALLR